MINQVIFDGIELDIFCGCGEIVRRNVLIEDVPEKCPNCKGELKFDYFFKNRPIFLLPDEDVKEVNNETENV